LIGLYCDLAVIPAKETEMLEVFHSRFNTGSREIQGFIDLKMLKLTVAAGRGPDKGSITDLR